MGARISFDAGKIAEFCRKWRIAEFALFGSVLRDDFRPDSDVDVLVTFDPDAGRYAGPSLNVTVSCATAGATICPGFAGAEGGEVVVVHIAFVFHSGRRVDFLGIS